jgi:hypothetical protein
VTTAETQTVESRSEQPIGIAHGLVSGKLRRRRFEAIPLRGTSAAHTAAQGRQPGDATTPVELSDLISSIAEIGVLQPILVEEIPAELGRPPRLRVVAGERRLRACRWGASHLAGNPHFETVPAIICPGPLTDEERRIWQLIENLAREPLRPGEQAAALLLHRCAILTGKLLKAGKTIPPQVYEIEDPVARFAALERIRGGEASCAAPWAEVLTRLGLQLSPAQGTRAGTGVHGAAATSVGRDGRGQDRLAHPGSGLRNCGAVGQPRPTRYGPRSRNATPPGCCRQPSRPAPAIRRSTPRRPSPPRSNITMPPTRHAPTSSPTRRQA